MLLRIGMVQRGVLMETGIEMFRILDRFVGHGNLEEPGSASQMRIQ